SNLVRSKKNCKFPWFPRPIALRLPEPSLNSLDDSPFQEKKSSTAESRSKCSKPTGGACDACASSRWSQKNDILVSRFINSCTIFASATAPDSSCDEEVMLIHCD